MKSLFFTVYGRLGITCMIFIPYSLKFCEYGKISIYRLKTYSVVSFSLFKQFSYHCSKNLGLGVPSSKQIGISLGQL